MRGQVILRHTERSAYRCFLPDLAGFTGFGCTGPGPLNTVQRKCQHLRCFSGGGNWEGLRQMSRRFEQAWYGAPVNKSA